MKTFALFPWLADLELGRRFLLQWLASGPDADIDRAAVNERFLKCAAEFATVDWNHRDQVRDDPHHGDVPKRIELEHDGPRLGTENLGLGPQPLR